MQAHWKEPWGDRRQEIVFIGAGIDWPALKAKLDVARATSWSIRR